MSLISHFFHIPFNEVENLFISDYRILLEQAINIANLYRQGEFELTDSIEKQEDFLSEIEFFKNQGRLN